MTTESKALEKFDELAPGSVPKPFFYDLKTYSGRLFTTCIFTHRVGGNQKRYLQSTNADQKSIETVFSIVICRQCGDKWQSKTLFLTIFDQRSSIVLAFSVAAYPVCFRGCKILEQVLVAYALIHSLNLHVKHVAQKPRYKTLHLAFLSVS